MAFGDAQWWQQAMNPMSMQQGQQGQQNSWFGKALPYAGFGLMGAGLIGALTGGNSAIPAADLSGALQGQSSIIGRLNQMIKSKEGETFNVQSYAPAREAVRYSGKALEYAKKDIAREAAKRGVSDQPLVASLYGKLGTEYASNLGSTLGQIGTGFEQMKQQNIMQLLGYQQNAQSQYNNLLATQEQIKAQREMAEQQANAQLWGSIAGIGGAILGGL
jgi:hypothetical protein